MEELIDLLRKQIAGTRYTLIASWDTDEYFKFPVGIPIPEGYCVVTKALDENGMLKNEFLATVRYSDFLGGYAKHGARFMDFDKPFFLPDSRMWMVVSEREKETVKVG
jgi:hypothetical protein